MGTTRNGSRRSGEHFASQQNLENRSTELDVCAARRSVLYCDVVLWRRDTRIGIDSFEESIPSVEESILGSRFPSPRESTESILQSDSLLRFYRAARALKNVS